MSKRVSSREIGEAVRRRRKELGLSQEGLAEILNVSYQQVQRYENGQNRFNVENIQEVAEALRVNVAYFFGSSGEIAVAETHEPYAPEDEKLLLKYFRRIEEKQTRRTVISVARMATKEK